MQVTFLWDPNAPVQLLTGPEEMPILVVVRENLKSIFACLNDCPDENLPLEKEGRTLPTVNSRGELICDHHAARFDACTGCILSPGNAHHVNRLTAGLRSIPVISANHREIELEIQADLLTFWRRLRDLRFRKSFGRGLMGRCRYLLVRLQSRGSAMGDGFGDGHSSHQPE